MKLPLAEHAVISRTKVVDYLLNAEHPRGRGKAQFFLGLGFKREEPSGLEQALLGLAASAEMQETMTIFGRKFVGEAEIQTPTGRSVRVVTVWILPDGAPAPELVTAYPAHR